MKFRRYLENVVGGLSHLANALTGGSAGNSLSARVGAASYRGSLSAAFLAAFIDAVLFSRNHCFERANEEGLI